MGVGAVVGEHDERKTTPHQSRFLCSRTHRVLAPEGSEGGTIIKAIRLCDQNAPHDME